MHRLWLSICLLLAVSLIQAQEPTLAEILNDAATDEAPQFTIFNRALEESATLNGLLNEPFVNLTVFAPTDRALRSYFVAQQITLETFLADLEGLNRLLSYHIVEGEITTQEMRALDGETVPTLNARNNLLIEREADAVRVNEARIVASQDASNGFMHIIDQVLVPENAPVSDAVPLIDVILNYALRDDAEFTILVEALVVADDELVSQLEEGRLTLFAPSDEAFETFLGGLSVAESDLLADEATLNDILRYHIVPGTRTLTMIRANAGNFIPTLLSIDDLRVRQAGGVFVDDARIITPDIGASNGMIHIIDQVLIPDGLRRNAAQTLDDIPTARDFILQAATADNPDFTLMLLALSQADPALLSLLDDPAAEFTLFLPTDRAFIALLSELRANAETFFTDENPLNALLRYHIAEGALPAASLLDESRILTLLEENIIVYRREGAPTLDDRARILMPDINVANGIIHVIDIVLLPEE